MKTHHCNALTFTLALLISFVISAQAQSYSVDWHKISGGGGTSTNGQYTVSGTIGQHDASAGNLMTGGNYAVTGGFWALVQAIQTPGAPTLFISHSGNAATVYWQDAAGWSLVQSGDLTTPMASWPASSSPSLINGTNYLNVVNPSGNLFFRLKH